MVSLPPNLKIVSLRISVASLREVFRFSRTLKTRETHESFDPPRAPTLDVRRPARQRRGLCPTRSPAAHRSERPARRGHRHRRQRERRRGGESLLPGPPQAAPRRHRRGRARRGRHPALGRRQGQPVLPARLQPRPWHRLRGHGRRHAGQHAFARPRPGLRGPQLPDPRPGLGRALPQGSLLRRWRRLRARGQRLARLRERARRALRRAHAGREQLPPPARGRLAHRAGPDLARCHRARRQQRTLGHARATAQAERGAALLTRLAGAWLQPHGHGLPEPLELDRPDPRTAGRQRRALALRLAQHHRWRQDTAHQPVGQVVRQQSRGADATQWLCHRLPLRPVLGLHLLPQQPRAGRPVRADRPPSGLRAAGHAQPSQLDRRTGRRAELRRQLAR